MSSKFYKYCVVPHCQNTTTRVPDKLFIHVPRTENKRKMWLRLAGRNPEFLSAQSKLYFCEDHFDLPNDMQNYMEYRVMGSVSQILMKPDCLPTKFECQQNTKRDNETTPPLMVKKPRLARIVEPQASSTVQNRNISMHGIQLGRSKSLQTKSEPRNTAISPTKHITKSTLIPPTPLLIVKKPRLAEIIEPQASSTIQNKNISMDGIQLGRSKSLQANLESINTAISPTKHITKSTSISRTPLVIVKKSRLARIVEPQASSTIENRNIPMDGIPVGRIKGCLQTKLKSRNTAILPTKHITKCTSISPYKLEVSKKSLPSTSGLQKSSRNKEEQSVPPDLNSSSLLIPSKQMTVSTKTSSLNKLVVIKPKAEEIVEKTIKKIRKRPEFYIGVPENCYHIIDIINKHTNIPEKYILLCLKKIRLDTEFSELADDFGMSVSYASEIFLEYIPIISCALRSFLINLDKKSTKRCLPIAFRQKYHNVSCVINCLEIEIQKPSNAVHQVLTWSSSKNAYTFKYLISSTPNGLVNYISSGYAGRISDVCIVENCQFLNTLENGTFVMADRGFKNLEQKILKAGCQLIRLPSICAGSELLKVKSRHTQQIVSLGNHVDSVIRRLRQFAMLKPQVCIKNEQTEILDKIVVIACALINLQ